MHQFHEIVQLLARNHNIAATNYDQTFLKSVLQKRSDFLQCETMAHYTHLVLHNPQEVENLIAAFNIGFSQFFRNRLTTSVLEQVVLPAMILKKQNSKSKEIRIWSAATATGQEAYTLAFILNNLQKTMQKEIPYRIFATDIDHSFIQKAQKGTYNQDEINSLSINQLNTFFDKQNDFYTVKPEIKQHIEFSVFDLTDKASGCPRASIFGDFDIVMCANILFYYTPEIRNIILHKLRNCLAAEGMIVTSETERDFLMNQNFVENYPQSAIFRLPLVN